jgi:alpha-amylase/alpha-mannosidase (GH57 family)
MTTKLILCFHNHQPVGNFDFVIEDAYQKSYKPFIEVLRSFPKIKVSLHFSGYLLEWMEIHHPNYIDELRRLIENGNLEILNGAYYEPILSNISSRDAIDQTNLYRNKLMRTFGKVSDGYWLAERVWEPHFPMILSAAGIKYLSLDEYHFQYAGIEGDDLTGYYRTESGNSAINVFPISKKLRYYMPYHSVDEVIHFLNQFNGKIITMADDAEKFGVWPGTYKLVYEKKWLSNFFDNLSKSDLIETIFYEEALKSKPEGRIFLPTCSYPEMMEWALPAHLEEEVINFKNSLDEDKKNFVKGGFWSNFSVKYPEINIMTKRMQEISLNCKDLAPREKIDLYKGQCNCAYWHGIFGGVYLPHLRHSIFEHLIKMEKKHIKKGIYKKDHLDIGTDEIILKNDNIALYLEEYGGSIFELDLYDKNRNIQSVMSRRFEYYHNKINMNDTSGVKTIHSGFYLKEKSVELIYDNFIRNSLNDFVVQENITKEDLYYNRNIDENLTGIPYLLEIDGSSTVRMELKGKITKKIIVDKNKLVVGNSNIAENIVQQWNIAVSSKNEKVVISDGKKFNVDTITDLFVSSFVIYDTPFDLSIKFDLGKEHRVVFYPIRTVSNSESGVEEILQGISINIFIDDLPYSVEL